MAKCGFCIRGKYQRLSDPYPMPCDECGGTGTLPDPPSVSSDGLVHGMYRSLSDKLEMVRSWPGVTGAMLDGALKEATGSGLVDRFDEESPGNPGLDIVVTVYKKGAVETLVYARARMKGVFGDRFWQWNDTYESGVTNDRIRYLQDHDGNVIVPAYRSRARIEVVDLFANWRPNQGTVPRDVRNADSAHFAVLFAAAQDPEWVRAMDGEKVPFAFAGGLELHRPGASVSWAGVPYVSLELDDELHLGNRLFGMWNYRASLPVMWK